MFEIENESIMIRVIGEGAHAHLEIDALLPRAVIQEIITLVLQPQSKTIAVDLRQASAYELAPLQ